MAYPRRISGLLSDTFTKSVKAVTSFRTLYNIGTVRYDVERELRAQIEGKWRSKIEDTLNVQLEELYTLIYEWVECREMERSSDVVIRGRGRRNRLVIEALFTSLNRLRRELEDKLNRFEQAQTLEEKKVIADEEFTTPLTPVNIDDVKREVGVRRRGRLM